MSDKLLGSNLRKNILLTVVGIIGIGFSSQLIKMQVIEHKTYVQKSDNNSVKKVIQQAPRGIFFDRNQQVLVSNKPSYTLQILPAIYNTHNDSIIESILNLEPKSIKEILYAKRGYSKFIPRVIKRNVSFQNLVWFEEHKEKLNGVNIVVEMQRDYSFDVKGAHIFGYLREINSQQLKAQNDIYDLGDFIGIKGAEKNYENYLRGKKGFEFVLVDSRRKTIGKYLEGVNDIKPTKGNDLVFTIDANLQKLAEDELEGYSGSLVAIEPATGEILAYVSAPEYNLEDFASVTSAEQMNQLRNDPMKPLFDRASNSIYPPGSTIKMLAALIGLQEGIISKNTIVNCKGGFQYGDRFFKCHGVDGPVNVTKAIERSCNTFFYKLILDIGLDRWAKYIRMFGFGNSIGLDIANDSKGIVPDTDYYNKVYGVRKWTKGNLVSLGIGQGELSVTTLQLAQYASLLANFGKTKQPHLVKGYIEGFLGEMKMFNYDDLEIPISRENLEIVRDGMFRVVNGNGTARHIRLPNIAIAGKTGTSQNPHGEDHALFIGFAPYENPKIALAVFVENVGFGGTYAAPIAQRLIKAYIENLDADTKDLAKL